jgi:uncharacterized alkaline shock family protein YloU
VADVPGPARPTPRTDPGQRGRLVVSERAVSRIAEAAALVDGTRRTDAGRPRTTAGAVAGVVDDVLGRSYPDVDCTVAGHRARVRVEVAAVWPQPAPQVAARVRASVGEALARLAGMTVDDVSVVVATYLTDRPATTRRVL